MTGWLRCPAAAAVVRRVLPQQAAGAWIVPSRAWSGAAARSGAGSVLLRSAAAKSWHLRSQAAIAGGVPGRMMSGQAEKDVVEAKAFLQRLRYSPEVSDGVIAALKSSGALLPTLYAMAGAWVGLPSRVLLPARNTHGTPTYHPLPACPTAVVGAGSWRRKARSIFVQCGGGGL